MPVSPQHQPSSSFCVQVPRLEVLWCPPLPRSAPPDGGAAAAAAMETLSLTDGKLPQLKASQHDSVVVGLL